MRAYLLTDCLGGQSGQPPCVMTTHVSCCVPWCKNNFRNSPGLAFYRIPKTRRNHQEYVRLFLNANLKLNSDSTQICIILVFLKVKSPRHIFLQLHIFLFFPFNSTFLFAILSCFNSAGTFHFVFGHICLHSRPAK